MNNVLKELTDEAKSLQERINALEIDIAKNYVDIDSKLKNIQRITNIVCEKLKGLNNA